MLAVWQDFFSVFLYVRNILLLSSIVTTIKMTTEILLKHVGFIHFKVIYIFKDLKHESH